MIEAEEIWARTSQYRQTIGEIGLMVKMHGWSFYRYLTGEQFFLICWVAGAVIIPPYIRTILTTRSRMLRDFETVSMAHVNPEISFRSSLTRLTKMPEGKRLSGILFLVSIFLPPLLLLFSIALIWVMGS